MKQHHYEAIGTGLRITRPFIQAGFARWTELGNRLHQQHEDHGEHSLHRFSIVTSSGFIETVGQ